MKTALALCCGAAPLVAGLAWTVSSATPERILAGYTTSFEGRLSNQRHNAVLAARKLDGRVIPPGQQLSFNDAVGSWSRDQGYLRAPVSFSGTLVSAWGGGVCQTSTTLYNAALLAGMEVIERHHHVFAANYVPPGRDAAVAFPKIDLRIRNPYPFPVRLETSCLADQLAIRFSGRGNPRAVSIQTKLLNKVPSQLVRFGKGPFGRIRNPGKDGYEVETWRMMGDDRQLLSVDSYPAMSRVVELRQGR
ncbi:MAG: VanW family protein [Armatimonadetes bacterium]|nr:VanW family protein [Armatimonadota bacterium]